jgi:hypothetical protein
MDYFQNEQILEGLKQNKKRLKEKMSMFYGIKTKYKIYKDKKRKILHGGKTIFKPLFCLYDPRCTVTARKHLKLLKDKSCSHTFLRHHLSRSNCQKKVV